MHSSSKKPRESSPLHKWHDEILRHLVKLLEEATKQGEAGAKEVSQIAHIIYIDQTRSPWPGSFLSKEKKEIWKLFLEKSVTILNYSVSSAALYEFASKITNRLLRELSASQIASTLLSREAERDTQIEHMIRQEFYLRNSSEETVSRSIQRYFREDARARRNSTEINSSENDPLRDLLGLPRIGRSVLPHEDIRVHMAKYLRKTNQLSTILSFDAISLESKLGKLFSKACTPIGFVDKQRKILLVDVTSPLAAQEIALSKTQFIARLRNISGFENVTDLKFQIKPKKIDKG